VISTEIVSGEIACKMRFPVLVHWKQTIRTNIAKSACFCSFRPSPSPPRHFVEATVLREVILGLRPTSTATKAVIEPAAPPRPPSHKQAWSDQEIVRRQALLREAASVPFHGEDERAVPRLRGRSCQSARMRRSGLARQHAMADSCGGQSQGQDREKLQTVERDCV
jgi:hypothetical protein